MITRQFPLHALGDLADGFQLVGAFQESSASLALAVIRLVGFGNHRHSVVREGVRVRPEQHCQHWRRTTLPLAASLDQNGTKRIPPSGPAQAEFLRQACAQKQRAAQAKIGFRKVVLAFRFSFLRLQMPLCWIVQR